MDFIHCILCIWLKVSSQELINNGTKCNILRMCRKYTEGKYQCALCDNLNSPVSVRLCRSYFIRNVLYMAKWVSQIPSLWYDFNDVSRCVMPFWYFRDTIWITHEKSMSEFRAIFYFISSPKQSHYRIKIQDPKLFWMCAEPRYTCNKGVTLQTATLKKIPFENIHVKMF